MKLIRVQRVTKKGSGVKSHKHARAATKLLLLLTTTAACLSVCFIFIASRAAASGDERGAGVESRAGDEVERSIDSALFTRAEFFGVQARVPFPTVEARNRLDALREQRPAEPRITLALARVDEKLGRYDLAESELGECATRAGESYDALEELAAFQHRRALFAREAATLERMLRAATDAGREQLLERLVRLAEAQKLDAYLKPEFFERVIAERPKAFGVVAGYIDRLDSQKSHDAALEVLRRYKPHFPSRRRYFLEKEVSILDKAGRAREAEAVYLEAFNPFWPDDLSEKFYDLLREHDRYRAYGQELREAFRRDPSDFNAAVRLFHFRKHAYEDTGEIFARLEAARAARGVRWEPDELGTVARLLIKEGDADTASRFLYTLVARGDVGKGTPARARVLYQLFELLSDAGGQRLALTRGDLRFYRDVAASDPHPGIVGGILSLIFSGTNPSGELKSEDEEAVKFFNRAAAYRIFNAYKEENPTSPELAQMYLDLVRLYTAAKEPQVASAALAEFEQRYGDAPRYAEVALKLADCYVLLGKHEEERAIYRRALDYLGGRRAAGRPLLPASQAPAAWTSEPTEIRPTLAEYPPRSNPGIKADEEKKQDSYYDESPSYRDFMSPEDSWRHSEGDEAEGDEAAEGGGASTYGAESEDEAAVSNVEVTYAGVLARYAASLAGENKTEDILALYAGEIKKYPDEQGLHEQLLQWLGQTNLFDEQERVYKEALERFPGEVWRDRLARWLLRRERRKEFEDFSRELVSKLDDREAESYLEKFMAAQSGASAASFESNLYLGLYQLAHERFPRNLRLVGGLLKFYAAHNRWDEYRKLLAEYYFVSPEIREQFLAHLSERGELRARLDDARNILKNDKDVEATVASLPYKLFRADTAARLSNYEEAVDAYRELNRLYPQTPEFAERLIAFTRSLGQHNRKFLEEASAVSRSLADAQPSDAARRTRAGEILAELGDYERARAEWAQLITLAPGEPDAYLEAATVNWDYFQYSDALEIIDRLRRETGDRATYAFEAGAILEAQHNLGAAVAEYVKALDTVAPGHARARRRLAVLLKRTGVRALVAASYARERAEGAHGTNVAVGYAELLNESGRREEASKLLAGEVARSDDADFIETARAVFSDGEDAEGERACLLRLISVSRSPRHIISYSLQLAKAYGRQGERDASAAILRGLVRKFPVNYGVLQEVSSSYRRLGFAEESLGVLRDAAARARGRYRRDFARRLAARLLELNRLDEARRVLEGLHAEDPLDLGVFRELARVYVRADAADALKIAFGETLKAVRATDADPREMRTQVADLRRTLVVAFTQLRDYRAAMEQHVEIVNRDPDDDENVEAAIAYARRYGGADALLDYYRKTAAQAYKNYRWDVVLARIYEAKGDTASAARSYREAITNQPEMVELHAALAEIYLKAGDHDSALRALERASELSNDDPQYVRRTAEVLEKAGRAREAAEVRKRLPGSEATKSENARDLFNAAAAKLSGDRAQAVEEYSKAFEAMSADPYKQDLRASEINGYVAAMRDAEGLDRIFERLWQLRGKLIAEANLKESTNAGKARALLGVLDGALPEAVGSLAAGQATGDELAPLFESLRKKTDAALGAPDAYGTLSLLQNIGHRAGFASLEEKILAGQKDAARASGDSQTFHARLRALASFYASGGEYARGVELLEAESRTDAARADFEYESLLAEYSRLAGDGARELEALRSYYDRRKAGTVSQTDPLVGRYLDVLAESGREELRRRAQEPSQYDLQLINFLIAKDERELAHEAIERAASPAIWKLARNAQVSLALREFDARGADYFVSALRPATVGELVGGKGAGVEQLNGDDWSSLEETYGRWLYLSGGDESRARARAALPAIVESRPRDAGAQAELGRWYLAQGDARSAIEHLSLAREESADDARTIVDLGSAYFLAGERGRAEAIWAQLVVGDEPTPDSCLLYLETLARHGLAAEAREKLLPVVSKWLKEAGEFYESNKQFEEAKTLAVALAKSFGDADEGDDSQSPLSKSDEEARAAYMRKLCEAAPEDTELPRVIVEDGLVGRARLGDFYELLVSRAGALSSYEQDYEFAAFAQSAFGVEDVDEAFEHSNAFRVTEPDAGRVKWQKEYLQYLLEEGRNAEAEKLIPSIEKEIERRYARPAWLRLAKVRLELRDGRGERAFAELKRYVGADVSAGLATVAAPSAERLSESVALLKAERAYAFVPQLLEAAYTQSLALGQYETPNFVGLARLAFERGDAARGEKLLRLMVALAGDETRDDAAAEVAALPEVLKRFAALARVEVPEQSNGVARAEALRLAAETAAAFGRFDSAAEFRTRLSGERPDDYANRVELARVLAAGGRRVEAAAQLASVISDRHAPRAMRWQSVWLAPEVTGGHKELWASLAQTSGAAADEEMRVALKARELAAEGHAAEAADILNRVAGDDPNPMLEFFLGVVAAQSGRAAEASDAFTSAMRSQAGEELSTAFGADEESALRRLIRLHIDAGRTLAALKLASLDTEFRVGAGVGAGDEVDAHDEAGANVAAASSSAGLQTLKERAEIRRAASSSELLGLLSSAAERVKDYDKALEFERSRLGLIKVEADRRASRERVARLTALRKKEADAGRPALVVDRSIVWRS